MQILNKHIKMCIISLIIRAKEIKSIMRYHFTPIRMATIKKMNNSKCLTGCREIRTNIHYLVGNVM